MTCPWQGRWTKPDARTNCLLPAYKKKMDVREDVENDAECVVLRLFTDFGEKLYNTAFLMCRNSADAEDLTMRTFENAMRKLSQYDRTRPAFPWLCGILTNCYRMLLRGKGRNALDFMAEPPEITDVRSDPVEMLARESDAEAVHEAVADLPERYRALIVLRYFNDLTVPQIAAITGVAEGSVKRKLHEAKKIMRVKLMKQGGLSEDRMKAPERTGVRAHI